MIKRSVISEVIDERTKQDIKWGQQNHNLVEWTAILTEEVGETAKEGLDHHFNNPSKEPTALSQDEVQEKRLDDYRKELIQVAAVAVAAIESLDRSRNGK